MYSFTCWSVAGRPGTSDLLLEARVRSCTHTPRPKGRIKPARRFGRTTAGLRPPCVRPNRPTYVSLTGQGCCRARVGSVLGPPSPADYVPCAGTTTRKGGGSVAGERRRLAAILAVDVVGYSRLVGDDEEGTIARLRVLFREVVQPMVSAHR